MTEVTERYDMRTLVYLTTITLKQYLDDHKEYAEEKDCSVAEMKEYYSRFQRFLGDRIDNNGSIICRYKYSKLSTDCQGGRLFSGNSIQGISCNIRGLLCQGITTDIDMVNCHPKILLYLCKQHHIPCAELEYYVANRDDVLSFCSNRTVGKTLFLKNTNNERYRTPENENPIFCSTLRRYSTENKKIQKALVALPEYAHIINGSMEKEWNKNGSAINKILCYYENNILQSSMQIIQQRNMEIFAPMFDGFLAYGDHYDDPSLLEEISYHVANEFPDLNMAWDYKEHKTTISIPDDFDYHTVLQMRKDKKDVAGSFQRMADEFEKNHLKIVNKAIYIMEVTDGILIKTEKQLRDTYNHMCYKDVRNDTIIDVNFISKWILNNPTIRRKDDIGIYPNPTLCPDNHYNLWRPFQASKAIEGYSYDPNNEGLKCILKHISILCDNDPAVSTYIIAWIAQMLQYPETKSIVPAFISEEGAGKGTFLKFLGLMMGREKILESTEPSKNVWGHFNGLMKDAFLVNLNEMSKKETEGAMGVIKGLVTDSTITVNEKGVSAWIMQSYHRFLISTNGEDPIFSKKGDRRNFIVRCSDELCGNKPYFTMINAYLDDPVVIKTCYDYFCLIPNMDKFGDIPFPITEYHTIIQASNESIIELWVKAFVLTNRTKETIKLSNMSLYRDFCDWNSEVGNQFNLSQVAFGKKLAFLKKKVTGFVSNRNNWDINISLLKQQLNIGCCLQIEN